MPEKIDPSLRELLAHHYAAADRVPVIVKLARDTSSNALEACGLAVTHQFDAIGSMSGTIRAADIENLERLPDVERIEFDGQMHALEPR